MKHRRQLLLLLLVLPALWFFWPDHSSNQSLGVAKQSSHVSSKPARNDSGRQGPNGPDNYIPKSPEQPRKQKDPLGHGSPDLESLLLDPHLPDEYVARGMRQIVNDTSKSIHHRVEALEHGLNFSPEMFHDLATINPELPVELAEVFLSAVMNWNERPADQISTYLSWVNHADEEIKTQSLEMLRFMLEDDAGEMSVDQLKTLAEKKIQELRAEQEAQKISDQEAQKGN